MDIAGQGDNKGAVESVEGTIGTFKKVINKVIDKVIEFFLELSSAARGSRRFLKGVLFSFTIIMFMQPATGCMVQFTPGDGICGNGVMEDDEMCDGSDFGGKTCADLSSYEHGELVCTEDCKVDLTMCHTCGDGRVEGPEDCDGENLNSETCESLGLGMGTLRCNENCTYDIMECKTVPFCSDDVREGSEVCDGSDLGGETCETQGFDAGDLGCLVDCSDFDTSGCYNYECGNNVIEPSEVCDGSDLGGETCETQGFDAGDLGCLVDCSGFDTSGCLTVPSITWITISGGTFDMGSNDGHSNEQPVHSVTVPDFEMTKIQVTVDQYEACVTAGECTVPSTDKNLCNWDDPGYEDHPINCITWNKARKFCEWAGGRLPSEAEWEYAARSGGQDITYPWGNDIATCDHAVMRVSDGAYGCGAGRTWPVCSKVAGNTDQGLCDMAGNVWEWVEDDWHSDYNGAPDDGSAWVDEPRGSNRILRGGGFWDAAFGLRAAGRVDVDPAYDYADTGVRCARDAP